MSTFYGSDTNCVTDVPLIDNQVTSAALIIGQRLARILQTPRGGFAAVGDDPDRGWDIRQYCLARLSPADIAVAQQQVKFECEKDEEVSAANVVMTNSNGTITFTISIVASSGPFTLVGNVTDFSSADFFIQ
jgi:hypothetical protein